MFGGRTRLAQRVAACASAIGLLTLFGLASCNRICCPGDHSPSWPRAYIVRIDTLKISPPSPSVGDTLTLRFWGLVGRDTCHSFTHFETTMDSLRLDVTAWAEESFSFVCGQMLVFLQGERLQVSLQHQGKLVVIVHQPDGSAIRDSVMVGPAGSGGARPN